MFYYLALRIGNPTLRSYRDTQAHSKPTAWRNCHLQSRKDFGVAWGSLKPRRGMLFKADTGARNDVGERSYHTAERFSVRGSQISGESHGLFQCRLYSICYFSAQQAGQAKIAVVLPSLQLQAGGLPTTVAVSDRLTL